MKPYVMPAHGEWVLLKIVSAVQSSRERKIIVDDEVQETEVPHIDMSLIHVSSAYGDKPHPYRLLIPTNDIVIAPIQEGRSSFTDNSPTYLREAVGLPHDAELRQDVLVGKNVMAQIHQINKTYWEGPGKETIRTFANIRSRVLSPEGVTIPLTLRDRRVTQAQVTWDTVHNLLGGAVPGTKVSVISVELGKQITAVRVGDEWRDINEV